MTVASFSVGAFLVGVIAGVLVFCAVMVFASMVAAGRADRVERRPCDQDEPWEWDE